jgi:hypothetical protein
MNNSPNDLQLDIDKIRARANQSLRYENQILPDDPVLSLLALNQALFQEYLETLKLSLIEAHAAQDSAIQQHLEMAKHSTTQMIENTAGHLQAQLEQVGLEWEARFQQTAEQEVAHVQQITQLTYWGAICWFVAGAITAGTLLARLLLG